MLSLEVGGTDSGQYGRIVVSEAEIQGSVVVSMTEGFQPAVGDMFELIGATDRFRFDPDQVVIEGARAWPTPGTWTRTARSCGSTWIATTMPSAIATIRTTTTMVLRIVSTAASQAPMPTSAIGAPTGSAMSATIRRISAGPACRAGVAGGRPCRGDRVPRRLRRLALWCRAGIGARGVGFGTIDLSGLRLRLRAMTA